MQELLSKPLVTFTKTVGESDVYLFAGITAGSFANVLGINDEIITVVGAQITRTYICSFKVVFYVMIPFSTLLLLAAYSVPHMERFLGNSVAKKTAEWR